MSDTEQNLNEPKRWLDEPHNVRKIIRGFYLLCALLNSVTWHVWDVFFFVAYVGKAQAFYLT